MAEALKQIEAPVIRWPGGCFADDYHYEDGIGPRDERPPRHNLWWEQPESNAFGTDEYIEFCRMIDTEPYICANVGSGSPTEAKSWVDYCNFSGDTAHTRMRAANGHPDPYDVKYWGVGNENWGCGGGFDPEEYASQFVRFALYMKRMDTSIETIACGESMSRWDTWNELFLKKVSRRFDLLDHLALHQYFQQGDGESFSDDDHYKLMAKVSTLEDEIETAAALIWYTTQGKRQIGIIVDEWGLWHPVANTANGLEQPATLRDALFAASALNMFIDHADVLTMTNIAQTINVLQCLLLTDGPLMSRTPTYHVFDFFKAHANGVALKLSLKGPQFAGSDGTSGDYLSASASRSEDGAITMTVVNRDISETHGASISVGESGGGMAENVKILTSDDVRDQNTPNDPDAVTPSDCDSMPLESMTFPPRSITVFTVA